MGTFGGTGQKYSPPQFRPLNKYVKSVDLFRCPSEKRQECTEDSPNQLPWVRFGSSYNMNVTFHYPNKPDHYFLTLVQYTGSKDLEEQYVGRRVSEIKKPRRMIFMGERPIHAYAGVRAGDTTTRPANYLGHEGDKPTTPIVFCDGHVDYVFMTPGLSGPKWALAQKGWDPFAPNEGD